MSRVLSLVLVVAAGCAPRASMPESGTPLSEAVVEAPTVENAPLRHREVHWFRTAAEYRAVAEQTYRLAGERVRAAAEGREPGTWGVILDVDETVLDNSEFERRIAETGVAFEEWMWSEWVREEAAGVIPGAGRFIRLVQSLGGRVALVTNRDQALCPATIRNLHALGLRAAAVLCETDTSEKEPRFRRVREGTAAEGLPPLEVVAWVGDNIGDFPDLDQTLRDAPAEAFEAFGAHYFILPNPMYGSWMGNDWR